jgi:putative transposase
VLSTPFRPPLAIVNECLNEDWFETLPQARAAITAWRQDYNEVRPHSSCRRIPPAKFAALHRQHAADAKQPTTNSINLSTGLPAE